jgi:hypothetical protein
MNALVNTIGILVVLAWAFHEIAFFHDYASTSTDGADPLKI